MKSSKTLTNARTPLDRGGWIDGAIEALADEGMAGLRVEVLAKRFGVTKGSFYWHFKDRQDLCSAMLETWKDGRLRDIDKQSRTEPGKETEHLLQIIDLYSASRNRKGIAIELAIRNWAQHDPQAAAVVADVDRYRLAQARRLFVAAGLSENEADSRSLLLYAYVFGQSLMTSGAFPDRAGAAADPKQVELRRRISQHIVGSPPSSPSGPIAESRGALSPTVNQEPS